MEKNQIRLEYSGFIIFGAQMLSIATGLFFTLLLTRNMTKQKSNIKRLTPREHHDHTL